jgi:hypothetical protein
MPHRISNNLRMPHQVQLSEDAPSVLASYSGLLQPEDAPSGSALWAGQLLWSSSYLRMPHQVQLSGLASYSGLLKPEDAPSSSAPWAGRLPGLLHEPSIAIRRHGRPVHLGFET